MRASASAECSAAISAAAATTRAAVARTGGIGASRFQAHCGAGARGRREWGLRRAPRSSSFTSSHSAVSAAILSRWEASHSATRADSSSWCCTLELATCASCATARRGRRSSPGGPRKTERAWARGGEAFEAFRCDHVATWTNETSYNPRRWGSSREPRRAPTLESRRGASPAPPAAPRARAPCH
eukprot:4938240-Prymnesium_polylepis.1